MFLKKTIILEVKCQNCMEINMIDKNYDLVKNILNDVFSIDMNFTIKKKSESHVDKNQIQDGAGGFSDQDNNQLRDKIVDLFDGEILT